MKIFFDKQYLYNLYKNGDSDDKSYRFQPQIIKKYIKVIDLMISSPNVLSLRKYNSLHYEKLVGNKKDLSSVRINDQYRIEFEEKTEAEETFATICNITDLTNHYK